MLLYATPAVSMLSIPASLSPYSQVPDPPHIASPTDPAVGHRAASARHSASPVVPKVLSNAIFPEDVIRAIKA